MLFIGDIHINSRYKDSIISNIKEYIYSQPEEKNIIFLWDYVYHFSYDRRALLELFELFIDLFKDGKNIYVLAGNHDWIAESFVFEEAKRSFDIFNDLKLWNWNKICFIDKVIKETIEWTDVLFFPFNINIEKLSWKSSKNDLENIQVEKEQSPKSINTLFDAPSSSWDVIGETVKQLARSQNKNEQISAKINKLLLEKINENNWKKLIVVHHYYFSDTKFPCQKSIFSFKDIALTNKFFDMENVYFVSGHLHQWFSFKNYFCTWSVWNTSPLEQNQLKFLYKLDVQDMGIYPSQINVNPYITVFDDQKIDSSFLETHIQKLYEDNVNYFVSDKFRFFPSPFRLPKLKDISLTFQTQKIDYDNLNEYVTQDTLNWLKDIKIKKSSLKLNQVINMLDTSSKDLQNSISDWKNLLKDYISQKFAEQSEVYIQKLKELKIL